MDSKRNKALLIIMDGWGHGREDDSNAIYNANTPFVDNLYRIAPNAELRTDGENVGLPDGQMGNSEVGHLNIGAGRIVYQDLVKINNAIEKGELDENKVLLEALYIAKKENVNVHLMGLLSDGGIHSSQDHLHALLDTCKKNGLEQVYIHAFTDGRDTDPHGGINYLAKLQKKMDSSIGKLASVVGRYYAMDRDKRWERTKKAYDLLINGEGIKCSDIATQVQEQYDSGISDEFIEPIVFLNEEGETTQIKKGDVVICFNYRTDRCRQISAVLTQEDVPEYSMEKISLNYFTMTRYDRKFKNVGVFFDKDNLKMTLGEVVSNHGLTQLRMAETEKYPHVTFFFSGGRELEFEGESRAMASSPKVSTYDRQPEMSAVELKSKAIDQLRNKSPNLGVINFANPDMVGHTGVISAIRKAVETTDTCCQELCIVARELGYEVIIIADHGNAELNINPDGTPHTAHTINPVPIFYLGSEYSKIKSGILADVAPTLLSILKVDSPNEMTGENLLS